MTTKKPATKATTAAKKAAKPAAKAKPPAPAKKTPQKATETQYEMPMEVKQWIDRAQSIMSHQKGEIERLKKENEELKSYKRWAEHRILRSEHES